MPSSCYLFSSSSSASLPLTCSSFSSSSPWLLPQGYDDDEDEGFSYLLQRVYGSISTRCLPLDKFVCMEEYYRGKREDTEDRRVNFSVLNSRREQSWQRLIRRWRPTARVHMSSVIPTHLFYQSLMFSSIFLISSVCILLLKLFLNHEDDTVGYRNNRGELEKR